MIKKIKLENGNVILVSNEIVGHLTNWIDSLNRTSQNLDKFGVLCPLILDTNKKIYWNGGFFAPKTGMPLSYSMGQEYYGQRNGTRQTDVVPLICALVSKDVLDKVGLPENIGEDIFVDADFCLTVIANGFKIYSTDNLTVVFQGSIRDEKDYQKFCANFTASSQKFIEKWGDTLKSIYKNPVLYTAKAEGSGGFARAARGYINGMSKIGLDVFFEPLDTVIHSVPLSSDEVFNSILTGEADMKMPQITWGQAPYFIKNSGAYKIGHCEFEASTAPLSWIRYCNMMDEIWVPTEWDKKKFEKAGVTVPIHIVHQGIDPDLFHPEYAPMQFDCQETFKFVCNGAWYPRKNLRNLIIAFQAEFRKGEDVCLIVKTMNCGLNKGIKKELAEIINDPESANVFVREDDVPDHIIPSLYTGCDCFVLPTRGEGWGLPIFEALACGLPVITTGYGAPNEVLRDENGEPLGGVHFIDWKPAISEEPYVYIEGLEWAEPTLMHLRKLMREVYNNRQIEKQKALETSKIIRQKFSWENVSLKIKERIEDIYKNKLNKND